ncbi:MAG: molybdenum cofactor guanylyltransferase [Omnitrophica bacterium]|nr:molybdenum cofactor guanylyltransferase [Candidatus Omnitrophota bacterium]
MNIAGAILCGGKNKRMGGRNKAFIKLKGIFLIQRILNVFREIFDEIILVTNSPNEYTAYNNSCRIVTDVIKNIGPLGGIHSGLYHSSKRGVFFIACDMPFLHNDIIKEQINQFNSLNCEAFIPRIDNFLEPLHAIYAKALADKINSYARLNTDYSVKKFLEGVNHTFFELKNNDFFNNIFRNLNTPQDLGEAKKRCE